MEGSLQTGEPSISFYMHGPESSPISVTAPTKITHSRYSLVAIGPGFRILLADIKEWPCKPFGKKDLRQYGLFQLQKK